MNENKIRKKNWKEKMEANPPVFFLMGYAIVILIGAGLLCLPIASKSGEGARFIDALFVSTSATCVTGLSPVVTVSYWTSFGHFVIISLIQLGGLGIVTAFASFGFIFHQRFGLGSRKMMMAEKGQDGLTGMVKFIKFVLLSTFIIEFIGACFLAIEFIPAYGVKTGIWYSIFHSISAFCNAGFDLIGDASLSPFSNNVIVILTISALIITAGLGFTVYLDLIAKDGNKRIKLHTKLVLTMTAFLLLVGTLGIYFMEKNNPETLGAMATEGEKVLNSFFQSVTTRTAGYFTLNQSALTLGSALLSMVLMFIGGSPGGVAGGVKTTTIISLFIGTLSEVRGSDDVPVFHRNIAKDTIRKSFVIVFISMIWCLVIIFILALTEQGADLVAICYEVISGFATVGLSRGLTSQLTDIGKFLVSLTMLFGKLGPLTVLYALTPREKKFKHRYGEEKILVG